MATYCIPPLLADKLIQAIKRDDVIGDIEKLYMMTSKERRTAFGKHVGDESARLINAAFERAMVSNKKDALAVWVKKTFSPESRKTGGYQSALKKIQELDEQQLLTPEREEAFLEDLVSEKLGLTISPQEAKVISEKAGKIEELAKETTSTGLPTPAYFKAKSEMEKYIQSTNPSANLKVMTSTIGRGMMLASIKSPFVNIESNTVQGILTALERRLATGRYRGLNGDFAKQYVRDNMKIYQASGYDTSRMVSLQDDKKILGEDIVHSQGEGPVRRAGRFMEDTVFKQLMGAPDVAYSSVHFADSANLASTAIAQGEKLSPEETKQRALAIFRDAVLPDPKTVEGELVRAQAIADAQYATYTNKSTYSDTALAIRGVLNRFSKDARIGDQIMPFVKTPANVIGAGIDYSGITLPGQVYLLPKALLQAKRGETEALKRSIRTIVRSGLGMTFAFLLSTLFEPDDFIGNYPVTQKEQELLALKNATTNSVRIGNKWISLDYLGPLSAPFIGIMYAKKYAQTPTEKAIKYYQGVVTQALKIPGVKDFTDVVKDIQDFVDEKKTGQKELTVAATNAILDYIRSRTVPALVNDIAKAGDPVERKAEVKKDPLARIKASIPGLRQTLPEKKTIFGDTVKAESALSTILFGSRAKTAQDTPIIRELVRLDSVGQLPSITEVEKTSTRVQELEQQLSGSQYQQALSYYRQLFRKNTEQAINSTKYKRADDEDKKYMIQQAKDDALSVMLKKYHYKKKTE